MTYAECMADAQLDAQALAPFVSITSSSCLRLISEAMVEILQDTRVIKKTISIATSALDSNGSIALDRSISLPVRVTFTPTSGKPVPCEGKGPDEFASIVMHGVPGWFNPTNWPAPRGPKIIFTLEEDRVMFWPFAALVGTFSLVSHAKVGVYQPSEAAFPNSFWYGWTPDQLGTLMASTSLPQELDAASIGITKYVAAQMLSFIPGWKKRFLSDYEERMARFTRAAGKVIDNAPRYPENFEASVNYGF